MAVGVSGALWLLDDTPVEWEWRVGGWGSAAHVAVDMRGLGTLTRVCFVAVHGEQTVPDVPSWATVCKLCGREIAACLYRAESNPEQPHAPRWSDSYLYAVDGGDLIKLGRSTRPDSRLSSLQTASPVLLDVLAVVPEWLMSEARAHDKWAGLREHGEWFRATPELREWVARIGRRRDALCGRRLARSAP